MLTVMFPLDGGYKRVQNRAARLVLNAPPRAPSLPLLQQLQWLLIEARASTL